MGKTNICLEICARECYNTSNLPADRVWSRIERSVTWEKSRNFLRKKTLSFQRTATALMPWAPWRRGCSPACSSAPSSRRWASRRAFRSWWMPAPLPRACRVPPWRPPSATRCTLRRWCCSVSSRWAAPPTPWAVQAVPLPFTLWPLWRRNAANW